MDQRLFDATEIDGRPRFYPPGQHPATHQERVQLAHLYWVRDSCMKQLEEHYQNYSPRVLVLPGGSMVQFQQDSRIEQLHDTLERCAQAIAYAEDRLAAFEEVESERKQLYLRLIERQERDDGA